MRFATWNLHSYGSHGPHEDRVGELGAVLAALDADVVALQEVCGRSGRALLELADAAGMSAYVRRPADDDYGLLALEPGGHGFGVALLHNPERVELRDARGYGGADLWHGLITATVVLGHGATLRVGSYHAAPFDGARRAADARRVVSAMTRPRPAGAAVLGADWNGLGENPHLDPDPYQSQPWKPDFVYQCQWEADDAGNPSRWWADRAAARVLHAGGLADAALTAHAAPNPAQPGWTTGHHDDDPFPHRRIDGIRLHQATALTLDVLDTPTTRALSDHLPVIATVST